MTKQIKKTFYKEKGFWACVATGIGGILAGSAGVVEVVVNVANYIFGG